MRRSALLALSLMLGACATGGNAPAKNQGDDRDDAARVNVELGQRYMQQGKLDFAMEKLQRALQINNNYPDAHTVIAVLYERIGDNKNAEEHYRRAVELQPKLGAPNNNYGQMLCSLGRLDEAEKYFQRAIADPFYKTPDLALTNAGLCQLRGDRLDTAEADFRRAVELNPVNAVALFNLASALYRKNDFFKARAFIQRYEAQGGDSADSLLLAHEIETHLGNADAARDYARRLRQQFPDSPQAQQLDANKPSNPS
jgi:type IV pilus assembly protein PilF